MDGWVRVLRPFKSISVISRRWKGEHERLCAMKRRLGSERITPPAGFEPATPWSEVGSANRSATRTLLHKDGICATKYALDTRPMQEPKTWVLLRLLHFILTRTTFKFNDRFYEQISSMTIGTKCAPSYAILFMDKLEQDFLSNRRLITLVWWKYIDDIFMI